ncbi:MAG: glycosyltransferase family 4 protein [Bacteroidota bacterium]
MKILICHNSYRGNSGEDNVIQTDIRFLKEHNVDTVEYIRSNIEINEYNLFEKLDFVRSTIFSRRSQKDVRALVDKEKPDVALVQNVFPIISPSIYYTLHELHVPIIQLVYNYRLICPNAILYTNGAICECCVKGNYTHALIHRCYRESYTLSGLYALTLAVHRHIGDLRKMISAYATPDLFLKKKLVEGGFPEERIFPIGTPFDSSAHTPSKKNNGWLLYFGRVVKEKGIFTLLKAMKELPESKLLVIGWGEAYAEAQAMILKEHIYNVHFRGPKYGSELAEIIQNALAVVLPTEWYDNSPVAMLHALSLGKPVIASNIDGIPEVLHEHENGLLFEPGNAAELAQKIRMLTEDETLRLKLSENARNYAQRELTSAQRVKKLFQVIDFVKSNTL